MQSTRTMRPREREQRQPSMAEAAGRTTPPTPPRRWRQWLAQRWARPSKGHSQSHPRRYVNDWDAHQEHVQLRTAAHPLDLLARTGGYDLRMALYQLML